MSDSSTWRTADNALHLSVTCSTFMAAIELVQQVALVAEEMDHHPDIDIRWRTVTFVLSTHSAGGITDLDYRLAEKIDSLIAHQN
jgi:4a-hydroxytetrahydrobiopterin dehydratase